MVTYKEAETVIGQFIRWREQKGRIPSQKKLDEALRLAQSVLQELAEGKPVETDQDRKLDVVKEQLRLIIERI